MDTRSSKLNAQIYEEASEWFVEFREREPDQAARREFDRWLRKSPEHLSAYLEIAAIWSEAAGLDPGQRWPRDRLIEAARPARDNVVPFVTSARVSRAAPGRRARLAGARVGIAIVAVAVGAMLGTFAWLSSGTHTYDTVVGEQRSVTLPDGSTVDLNARSRIEIRYSDQRRDVALLEGQALFSVAKDPSRPFVVTSGNSSVRAVGTQFDVNRRQAGTVVTVLEGQVAIFGHPAAANIEADTQAPGPRHAAGSAEVVLTAGSQVVITDASIQKTPQPNVSSAIAWRQRRLVFDSASLVEVAEEFNRYNVRQLVIQDPDLQGFHISGVFSSTDPASLIRFLRERPEVKVIETASEIRVTKSSR